MNYMTLYGNRLSCDIPSQYIHNNHTSKNKNFTAIILSSNLFSCKNEKVYQIGLKIQECHYILPIQYISHHLIQ